MIYDKDVLKSIFNKIVNCRARLTMRDRMAELGNGAHFANQGLSRRLQVIDCQGGTRYPLCTDTTPTSMVVINQPHNNEPPPEHFSLV